MQCVDNSAAACWARFCEAADDLREGRTAKAHAIVARIRATSGNYAAETARRELRAFAGQDDERRERANRYLLPAAAGEM